MNELAYEIYSGDSYNSQYKKRGYCIDFVDNKYQYIICSGERSTGGYEIKNTGFDVLNNGTVIVTVEETTPAPDMVVTAAFTYPNCSISFSHELTEGIIIKSSSGEIFEFLGNYSP